MKRSLAVDTIVVLDSLNYIKGWRYQLHCEAKAARVRSCVVHVGTGIDFARQENQRRLGVAKGGHAIVTNDQGTSQYNVSLSNGPFSDCTSLAGGIGIQDPYDHVVHEELLMRYEEPNEMARWDRPLFTILQDDDTAPHDQIWREIVLGEGEKTTEVKPNQATVTV